MDPALSEALGRIALVQDTIEQQLDEIQNYLAALNERQQAIENTLRNNAADLQRIKQVLNIPPPISQVSQL